MDPNEAPRDLIEGILNGEEMHGAADDLTVWINRGGFKPVNPYVWAARVAELEALLRRVSDPRPAIRAAIRAALAAKVTP